MVDSEWWIDRLELRPHPEGGWFREYYRSPELIPGNCLPERFDGDRSFSTAIYFLLRDTDFSALHRIRQDELWHFYDGSPLTIHMIDPVGEYSTATLGRNVTQRETLATVVPTGWLFGAVINNPASWSLVGCTVAPGFDFADFTIPDRTRILEQYPQYRDIIERLTR